MTKLRDKIRNGKPGFEAKCALGRSTWQSVIKHTRNMAARRVWGHAPPSKIFDFRPSEIVFGAVLG